MNQVGGVVGMNGGKVTGSGNTGAITANYYFGGVVGYTTSSSAACVIEKCYNTGTLTMDEPAGMGRGAAYMGGVTSRIYSNKTVISKCYNTGDLIVGASVSSSRRRRTVTSPPGVEEASTSFQSASRARPWAGF